MDAGSDQAIVSVLFGRYHNYVDGWIRNLRSVGCEANIYLLVLDGRELQSEYENVFVENRAVDNPSWGAGDYARLRKIHDLCRSGTTTLQIDIDICFNENPLRYCGIPFEFIISRGLGFPTEAVKQWGFSLCTGFYIAKPRSLDLLTEWLALETRHRGFDQEDINRKLLDDGIRWSHDRSDLVRDNLLVSTDDRICVLPERAITRDCRPQSFGAVHNQSVLDGYLRP